MAYCDMELNTYKALEKRVPFEDQNLYDIPETLSKQQQQPETVQESAAIVDSPLNTQQKLKPKRNQNPRNMLLAAIVIGLIALNILLIICLTVIALQSYTEKREATRIIEALNKTAQLIMDSNSNTVQSISSSSILSELQSTSHHVLQQIIVNMTARLLINIEYMMKNTTAKLMMDSHTNTYYLEETLTSNVEDVVLNVSQKSADSISQKIENMTQYLTQNSRTIVNQGRLLEQSISHHQVLQETISNMTVVLIEDMVKNITARLITTHMNTVHDLEEIMNKSTGSITQLIDTHMKNTTATDQLMTQNLDTAITLIKNNNHNTLSSQLASLTSAINTHSATSSSTKNIVQNMESTLETLNTQHKILLRPASCQEIKDLYSHISSGYYIINGEEVYCRMGELCGTEGGWTRLAYLNMNDTTVSCPSTLSYKYSSGIRACARPDSSVGSCASVQFPSNSISYSEVCGRVVGYQYGSHEAANAGSIDSPYLEGISITHGNPRQHVWSLMVGRGEISDSFSSCPCNSPSAGTAPPSFVGNDYFCESGNPTSSVLEELFPNDLLWDGKQCGGYEANCCSAAGLPWFHKTLSTDTTDYLELRNCGDQVTSNENVYINFYEIYIK